MSQSTLAGGGQAGFAGARAILLLSVLGRVMPMAWAALSHRGTEGHRTPP